MDAGFSPARQARDHHRHELRTLTYVTLDQANGGIVRNLNHDGMGVQVVAALRPHQQLRVRFELRYPRLRVETRGEVVWATLSGQCGIRFLDLSPDTAHQIDEWIFGNLLDGAAVHMDERHPMFETTIRSMPGSMPGSASGSKFGVAPARQSQATLGQEMGEQSVAGHGVIEEIEEGEDDGLMVSAAPLKVIELSARAEAMHDSLDEDDWRASPVPNNSTPNISEPLDWLSQPLSGNGLAWAVDALVVFAGLLLFALIFLMVTRELPKWPVAMIGGMAVFVTAFYCGFFKLFGGTSPGTRLARLSGYDEEEELASRFR